jgi:hypothetical protein
MEYEQAKEAIIRQDGEERAPKRYNVLAFFEKEDAFDPFEKS